jgi:5-methylcytosine-specific restriction endonuclease McrA
MCGIKTPIDSLGTQLPDAPELEHVVALSQGGSHTYSNIRCACRSCNSAKAVGERREAMTRRQPV